MVDLPQWLVLAWAEMGQAEVPGRSHNARILSYARDIGAEWVNADETPWCAAFVGAMLQRAGLPHTGSMRARSYETYGQPCAAVPGAIVVLKRTSNPAFGHVGFLDRKHAGKVFLVGGNQGDAVSLAGFMEADVVAYRWPPNSLVPGDVYDQEDAREVWPYFGKSIDGEAVAQAEHEVAGHAEQQQAPAPEPRTHVEVAAKSRTIFGALVAALGSLVMWLQDAVGVALDAAQQVIALGPVKSLALELGANVANVGFAMAIGGIAFAIVRRVLDGDRGAR